MAHSITIYALFLLLISPAISETEDVKRSLITFLTRLSQVHNNVSRIPDLGWTMSSDPCSGQWAGVSCNSRSTSVRKIVLEGLNFSGKFDAISLCAVQSLSVLSLNNNMINGGAFEEIGRCKQLTHLYISGNKFSGEIPDSLSRLNNLKRLDVSHNNFSGVLPNDLARISGLVSFLAENNRLSGEIPEFDFTNLQLFNVSFNNFSGQIPDLKGRFGVSSVMGNPQLCGKPLSNSCPPSPSTNSGGFSVKKFLIYSGFVLICLVLAIVVVFILIKRKKAKEVRKVEVVDNGNKNPISRETSSHRTGNSRSEFSSTSVESGMVSSSLVVLSSPVMAELKLEELLKAPAELIGRGRHGSLYKVVMEGGNKSLAVKRMKDWNISDEEFKLRMQKLDQVKHPNVLPAVAFYCSKEEKLVVYEYQQNGSLFGLLHGTKDGQKFDWGSRLNVAASVADALAFMHVEFHEDGIAHGNIKSSNILFNNMMEPCISEYGLMVAHNSSLGLNDSYDPMKESRAIGHGTFKVDIYGFGVVLLELLTGNLVQNNEPELARWVNSVVREEWTSEVFDESLIVQGASEDRMVSMLQVALKCINPSPEDRPNIYQVALMINDIREEEERSIVSEP